MGSLYEFVRRSEPIGLTRTNGRINWRKFHNEAQTG
jgi:hypothetical protein